MLSAKAEYLHRTIPYLPTVFSSVATTHVSRKFEAHLSQPTLNPELRLCPHNLACSGVRAEFDYWNKLHATFRLVIVKLYACSTTVEAYVGRQAEDNRSCTAPYRHSIITVHEQECLSHAGAFVLERPSSQGWVGPWWRLGYSGR